VGWGKSTLLTMIMNELEVVDGQWKTRGKVCYVEQEPFILAATIRENIIFGQPYDDRKLKNTLQVWCLEEDVFRMDQGINTLVGSRGTDLSGGQKARISLARAVYSDADIYLLDDPLSALDPAISKRIYKEWVWGHLNDKWVILVTHQVHFLTNVKNIFIMTNGRIVEIGSYDEINDILEKSINMTHIADTSTESIDISDNAVDSSCEERIPESEEESSYLQQPNSDDSVESESSVNSLSMSLSLISLGYWGQFSRLESIVRGVSQRGRVSVNIPSANINRFSVESPHLIRGLNQSVYERYPEVGISK
jgi:ATP-binding cassette, subfamily C (CFTR/MRP), member 4